MNRHSTGITIVLTVALAAGLSFAPLPDAWRPIPSLDPQKPETIVAALLPKQKASPTDALIGAPGLAANPDLPGDDAEFAAETAALDAELDAAIDAAPIDQGGPLPPTATLGASELRAVRRLERLAKKVGAQHVDIEPGCRERAEDGTCLRTALDGFFERLEALQRGEATGPLRIVHLGDSQIASDHISDVIRHRLQLRYGSGGPGFLFVDRPTKFAGRKVRTGEATDGWEIVKLTDRKRDGLLGFSGVRFTARSRQRTEFKVANARVAELAFVTQPAGGQLEVLADGRRLSNLLTRFPDTELAFSTIPLPEGTTSLQLTADGGDVSLFGVSLETGGPGIVYDSVGLPGALYEVYLRAPEDVFAAQLARRDPGLVIVMLGGNEAYEMGRGWIDLDDVRANATKFVKRLQATVPDAACLLIAPMDAGTKTVSGEIEPRAHTVEVGKVIREIALEHGCAFWNLYEAMGGRGSVARWRAARVFNSDLVHPLPRGADLIGHLFDFALERARAARAGARNPRFVSLPGLVDPEGKALARTRAKLKALEKSPEDAERVSVVQLGASHTASHAFTDVVRAELAKVFGDGGRGFVAAGRPSERLERGKVRRALHGAWQISDARERPAGEMWGLTGARAEGEAGARLEIEFGQDNDRDLPATVSVYYLDAPGMGRMSIRIDGADVAVVGGGEVSATPLPEVGTMLDRAPRKGRTPEPTPRPAAAERALPRPADGEAPPAGRVKVLSFPVTGTAHTVEIVNEGPGPITVFGASVDQDRGGVTWDALGLPGATAMLAASWDEAAFVEQLRARRADLYVLFFGTNESALPDLSAAVLREANLTLLRRMRAASPDAECLIIGPTDRLEKGADGRWEEAPSGEKVLRHLQDLAAKEGCAFWSARAAMGGPRSMARWQSVHPPLGHPDGVHLTREGYEALAHAFADDLIAALRSR